MMTDVELMGLIKNVDPNAVRIPPGVRRIVDAVILAEREACAAEVERMMMYPGGRCEAPAHDNVWAAAKAIRMRSNTQQPPTERNDDGC